MIGDTVAPDASVERATDTRVFPDTAAPDASVARAAKELGSVAGPSSKVCRERRASNHPLDPGIVFPLEVRYHKDSWLQHGSSSNSNSNSSNSSSSSNNNDTTSTHDS